MSSTLLARPRRVAVLGGTGFVGGRVAAQLAAAGVEPVILSRRTGVDLAAPDVDAMADALAGCSALVICAGINRELGPQTYDAVHIRGTAAAVEAARRAGVRHVGLVSFLRARPDGPSPYHRSKWAAEAIVRDSGIPSTILKCGVIYGNGDHLLDHLSHALHTLPVFGLVGLQERLVAPVAVDDVARILVAAATGDPRLRNRTLAVLGPETLPLGAAVRRVGAVVERRPVYLRLPVAAHHAIARACELVMRVPLVSVAQVHILAEGVVEAAPPADPPPPDLAPATPFSEASIRAGLPAAGAFGCRDLRWWPAT